MTIVILGGSALSTPNLWSWLNQSTQGLHVVLMGRHSGRLHAVSRACHLSSSNGSNTLECRALDDPAAWNGLRETRVFVIQTRNGGYAARSIDETLPLRFGVCGDEGLGPGGLSAGIRNWRAIHPLLQRIGTTAPNASVLMVSSPVSLLVRAASRAFPRLRIMGICELPWTTLLDVGCALNIPPESIEFDYAGVNHLGWFYRLEARDENLVHAYGQTRRHENDFPSAALIDECGAVPLGYLKLQYHREATLESQRRNARPRGAILAEFSARALEIYATGSREDIERILRERPSPWYPHAIGPFLGFMAGRTPSAPFFLSTPNRDFDPDFEPDDILETAFVAEKNALRRLPRTRPIPQAIRHTLTEFVRYERLASRALVTSGKADIQTALDAHPWTRNLGARCELAKAIHAQCS